MAEVARRYRALVRERGELRLSRAPSPDVETPQDGDGDNRAHDPFGLETEINRMMAEEKYTSNENAKRS